MAIWNPTVFLTKYGAAGPACTEWSQVGSFDYDWTDAHFFWTQRLTIYYNVMFNNGAAIRLLIDKCNSLQAEIDAMSGAEVTMDAILNAIWNSDKLRWFHFINYIDSMRAGIWNTEIYGEHLAEWYRHFSTA